MYRIEAADWISQRNKSKIKYNTMIKKLTNMAVSQCGDRMHKHNTDKIGASWIYIVIERIDKRIGDAIE